MKITGLGEEEQVYQFNVKQEQKDYSPFTGYILLLLNSGTWGNALLCSIKVISIESRKIITLPFIMAHHITPCTLWVDRWGKISTFSFYHNKSTLRVPIFLDKDSVISSAETFNHSSYL